ncbi:MAG: hypothetical protein LLG20_13985 [Acidobacteriales bacterium]|nr:hypothetical protein [Terriglobales bacterium]
MARRIYFGRICDWTPGQVALGLALLVSACVGQVKENLGTQIQAISNPSRILFSSGGYVHYVGFYDTSNDQANIQLFHINLSTGQSYVTNLGHGGRVHLYAKVVASKTTGNLWFTTLDGCKLYEYNLVGAVTRYAAQSWQTNTCSDVGGDGANMAVEGPDGSLWFTMATEGKVALSRVNPVTRLVTDYGVISAPPGNPTCAGCYRIGSTLQADANYVYVGMRDMNTNGWWLTIIKITDKSQQDCFRSPQGSGGGVYKKISDGSFTYDYYNGSSHTWYAVPSSGACPVSVIPEPPVNPWYWNGTVYFQNEAPGEEVARFNVNLDVSNVDASSATAGVTTMRYRNPAGAGSWVTKQGTLVLTGVPIKRAVPQSLVSDNMMLVGGQYLPDSLHTISTAATVAKGAIPRQSTYAVVSDGTYWYFDGYDSTTFRYDPRNTWTVTGGTPATACKGANPTNPCLAMALGGTRHYYSAIGNDDRLYTAGAWERDRIGGDISWYNPADHSTGTYRSGPPSLECFTPYALIPISGGTTLLYSGGAQSGSYGCAETVGKIFAFDVASHSVARSYTVDGVTSHGKLVLLQNGHVMGLIKGTESSYTLVSFDPATGKKDWIASRPGNLFNGAAYYDSNPVLGPDGYVYYYSGNNLVKASPSDGSVTTVYADTTSHAGMSVASGPWGKALYFWGSTNLYRMILWQSLVATPGQLTFAAETGGAAVPPQAVVITSTNPNLAIMVTASSTGNWLKVSMAGGKVPASVNVWVDTAGLAPGSYQGSVTIASGGASNSPVIVPVTLTVQGNNLRVDRSALSFAFQRGGAIPATQSLIVSSSESSLSYTASVSTDSGGNWLQAIPLNGATPGTVTILVDPRQLSVGAYRGAVRISAQGAENSSVVTNVTLAVTEAGLLASAASLSFSAERGDSVPLSRVIQIAGSGGDEDFSVSASGGAWLSVDRSTGRTPADLTVSVNPAALRAGTYTGTINLTTAASIPALAPIPVTLLVTPKTPRFSATSVVNAASLTPGLTPGGLVSIFGSGLSELTGIHDAGGQTTYEGVRVLIAGRPAPLLAIAAQGVEEQINLQVPFETAADAATVEVINNSKHAAVEGVAVLTAQPGIFQIPLGGGVSVAAAIHVDGRLVTPNAPAQRKEVISLFLTGAGAVHPAVATGNPGPVPPAQVLQSVTVGVANVGCTIYFSGYAPGFLGLYQVNFEVPSDVPTGASLDLVVKVGEASSSTVPLAVA